MKHVRFPNESGFSVVEIILASALFLIFSGASIVVVLQGFDANRVATETIVANQYASEGIEAVRSIRNQSYAKLVATAGTGVTQVPAGTGVWTFSGVQDQNTFAPVNKYTRVITISAVRRDASGNIVSSGGTVDPNTMKATSTVTWNHTPTRINSVVQTTYLSNWQKTAVDWYNSAWLYRQAITINHTKVSGTQTNFPVLINLASNANLTAHAQASGNDILFTDSTGLTKIPHEIELYTSGTGALVAWVNLPTISSSSDTTIYMYYGNSTASNQQNVTGVWNNNFGAVYHFSNQGGTLSLNDSTSNGNDGTNNGVTTTSGKIDGSGSYNGLSNYINVANSNTFNPGSNSFSGIAWVNPANISAQRDIIQHINNDDITGWAFYLSSNFNSNGGCLASGNLVCFFDGSTEEGAVAASLVTNQWNQVAFVKSGTTITFYANGASIGSSSIQSTIPASTNPEHIGADVVNNEYYLNGGMDEFEYIQSALSAGWILTEYNNQSSPSTFYAIAAQEQL
jgi:hypothetical protein